MARERYLLDDSEDTIHSNVIELKTAKEKRKNWWYYHKGYLLIAVIAVALVAYAIFSVAAQPKPDYSVVVLSSFSLPDEVAAALEEHLSRYADDRNNNGKAEVKVVNYTFSDISSPEANQASFIRFAGDAENGDSIIYLCDEEALGWLGEGMAGFFQYNSGNPMSEDAGDYENAMRPWDSFQGLKSFAPEGTDSGWTTQQIQELCGRLNVFVRATNGSPLWKDEKKLAYHADSLLFLERLESGEALR